MINAINYNINQYNNNKQLFILNISKIIFKRYKYYFNNILIRFMMFQKRKNNMINKNLMKKYYS